LRKTVVDIENSNSGQGSNVESEAESGICNINKSIDRFDRKTHPVPEMEPSTRRKRGRPRGSGRKHPERSFPKYIRHFSPLAQTLLTAIALGEREIGAPDRSEAEILEDALVRLAEAKSNELPGLAALVRRAKR
jgi:hypothetical protein